MSVECQMGDEIERQKKKSDCEWKKIAKKKWKWNETKKMRYINVTCVFKMFVLFHHQFVVVVISSPNWLFWMNEREREWDKDKKNRDNVVIGWLCFVADDDWNF